MLLLAMPSWAASDTALTIPARTVPLTGRVEIMPTQTDRASTMDTLAKDCQGVEEASGADRVIGDESIRTNRPASSADGEFEGRDVPEAVRSGAVARGARRLSDGGGGRRDRRRRERADRRASSRPLSLEESRRRERAVD